MRAREFLIEFDEKKILSLAAMLAAREQDGSCPKTDSPIELAKAIEKMGVTNGEQIFWLLHRYLKRQGDSYGINRWEDIASRAIPAMQLFDQLKKKPNLTPKLPTKDLNQIKRLGDLESMLDVYKQQPDQTASQREKEKAIEQEFYSSNQAKLLYNDANVKVVIPKTESASCYFGKNTKWCTAAKNDNRFGLYNAAGPLYIILIKKENARYQFQWVVTPTDEITEDSFMDERDEPVNPRDLANKYPVLWQIFGPISEKNKSLILVKNPSPELQMAAVTKDGTVIRYIKNPSPEIQMAAVQQNGRVINYIDNPTLEMQMAAVRQNGQFIQYIKNPSPAVQLAAIENFGYVIRFIKNPSPEMQWAAVKQSGLAIKYIKNPSPDVQWAAVKQTGLAIQYIKDPSPEMQMAAVKKSGWAIQHIKNPSLEMQIAAVKQSGIAIYYIKNPSPEMQMFAVKQNGSAIQYIKNPSPDVQWAAVKQTGLAIQYIKDPSPEMQMAAVKQNPDAIRVIKNPSPEVLQAAQRRPGSA